MCYAASVLSERDFTTILGKNCVLVHFVFLESRVLDPELLYFHMRHALLYEFSPFLVQSAAVIHYKKVSVY